MSALPKIEAADDHEALLQFMYLAPVGLAQTSSDGEFIFVNPVSAQLLMPLSRDGNLSNLFTALENVAPELRSLVGDFTARQGVICDGMHVQLTGGVRGKSDPKILSLSLVKLDDTRLMAVLSDVSLQVKRERLLRRNEAWLNAILTGITDYAVISLDSQGGILRSSAGLERVAGFIPEAVIGQPYSVFYPEGAMTPERLQDRLHEARSSGWSVDEGWRIKSDGSCFWGSAMIAPLHDLQDQPGPDEGAYCLIIRDITDKREASEQLRLAMCCDHLTGLANRRTFFDAGEVEIQCWYRSPRQLSIIMLDADHFKKVNDTWGHSAGDAVLRNLAAILTKTFRQVDVVARLGGEEFAVLLPSTGSEGAVAVATRLRQAVEEQTVMFDGSAIRYTVSGGVATMDATVNGLDDLMKRADLALYDAKSGGRNRIAMWAPA